MRSDCLVIGSVEVVTGGSDSAGSYGNSGSSGNSYGGEQRTFSSVTVLTRVQALIAARFCPHSSFFVLSFE